MCGRVRVQRMCVLIDADFHASSWTWLSVAHRPVDMGVGVPSLGVTFDPSHTPSIGLAEVSSVS